MRLGLLVVLGGAVVFRLLPIVLLDMRQAFAAQEVRRAQLERARAEVSGVPALEDSARILTTRMAAAAERLLAGSTESAALADLSAQLRSRAWRSQARLERVDPVPDSTTAGQLRRISVIASYQGDARSLVNLLVGFQSEAPLIVPMRLSVVAGDPLGESRGSEVLAIEIWASSWYLSGGEQ